MIPFNKPYMTGRELKYIRQAVDSGKISGDGIFTCKCHTWHEQRLGSGRVFRELSPAMLRLHRRRVGFESLMRETVAIPALPEIAVPRRADPVGPRLLLDHSRDILPGLLH